MLATQSCRYVPYDVLPSVDSERLMQVTLWGYPTSSLPDYAGKLWSGLLADFYLPRWILFCKTLLASVSSHSQFPEATFLDEVIAIETAWANSPALYPTTPVGNALSTAQRLFAKYVDYVKGAKARLATLVR